MVDQTLSFYAQNAETYAARSVVNPKLAEFLQHVAPGGFILELGSGSGLDAKFMIENGFKVDPTDGSYELAEEASRLLGQPVRHMYFEDLDAIEQYDGIYASASLLHAKRSVLPEIVKCIHRALKTSGTVWASFKDGSSEGYDQLGRYYNYMQAEELASLWRNCAPWGDLSFSSWQGSGYDGLPTLWHGVTARR
ncbi:hypothetical protein P053_00860 [Brucella abortus 01-4165]|uniref:SAM (And some other nucleotide) binding motif:Site-specific DNA-methyltransferase (Cytosine-N4-specific) n=8 Tax=Brucella TaxID=234 RepID=Q2YPV1_BRUA2|nr:MULTISPECIES: class I SAM-dependent methyltransferase [Brucella]ERU02439.1 hypothetical protein P039_02335 [Brucella abortus 07-0994-2411]EXU83317.1 methyltransferase [Brucella melitensis 548]KFH20404.1 methyltransferase [Brucella abortus LMN1]KFH21055.1 methyltransferase [Brucella abortus LMN2]AAX74476.1 conserved hypothetical protein [Brucella abortus bv. 1 str. 9-941]